MTKKEVVIIVAEDDDGHAALIERNLARAGVSNRIVRFHDGQEVLDFFFPEDASEAPAREPETAYLLLLDIRMPKVDGVQVLAKIKAHGEYKKIPVIMLTTTDDPKEVERCHLLGCSHYITKPVDYAGFAETLRQLGLFLVVVEIPDVR